MSNRSDWIMVMRSWTPDYLATFITNLQGQMSIFSAQGVGQKNFQRDLNELSLQMAAAVYVQQERCQPAWKNAGVGITDFSQLPETNDSGCDGYGWGPTVL